MQQQPMDPATPISITLPAGQWDQVLDMLGNGPWKVVHPLIQKIMEQAQGAVGQGVQPNGAGEHPPLVNGALPS